MSYEGYSQFLCAKGHYWTVDCYAVDFCDDNKCPECGSKAVWENMVNTTNGSYEGNERIDGYVELEVLEEAKTCKCDKCGNEHVVEPVRYKVPKGKGRKIRR